MMFYKQYIYGTVYCMKALIFQIFSHTNTELLLLYEQNKI
jgi:hypothetical protein